MRKAVINNNGERKMQENIKRQRKKERKGKGQPGREARERSMQ